MKTKLEVNPTHCLIGFGISYLHVVTKKNEQARVMTFFISLGPFELAFYNPKKAEYFKEGKWQAILNNK